MGWSQIIATILGIGIGFAVIEIRSTMRHRDYERNFQRHLRMIHRSDNNE